MRERPAAVRGRPAAARGRPAAARWRRSIALALALVALLLPAAAPTARAAEELRLAADATYRVDTDGGVVRVRIDLKATNLKANGTQRTATQVITTRYYYDRLLFNIQREARSVRATSNGSSLRVGLETKPTHRQMTVHMPDLYFRQSRDIRIEYSLPGGKPRSSGDIRVGAAFATFTAWAWGDAGRSTVRVVLPNGFTDRGFGDPLEVTEEASRVLMSSGAIADPFGWFAVVIADRPAALTDVRVGSAEAPIVIRAWPEDTVWRDQVSRVLDEGVPVLQELVALDWPVAGELTVTEVHTPLLEGYAGVFSSLDDSIRISEDLDTQTILHEAAHAWFDQAFVDERWINEGLAEEYAAQARERLDLEGPAGPDPADPAEAAAFPLDEWPQPSRIDEPATAARERYGYAASWTVMRQIVAEAGADGMRAVFDAVADRTISYVGDRAAESTGRRPDGRGFLDLVQEVGGAEGAEELIRTWVAPPSATAELDARAAARAAYHALDDAAGEWASPYLVRERLSSWAFPAATEGIAAASEVLADRDALAAISGRLGASAPNDVETRFEEAAAIEDLDALEAELEGRADVAELLITTRDQLAVPRTPLADLGLAGEAPLAGLDAGLAAFAAGDLEGARAASVTTAALLVGAEEVGRGRALAIGAVVVGLILLAGFVTWFLRRRSGRRSAASGVAMTWQASPVVGEAAPELDARADAATDAAPDAPTTLAPTPDPAMSGADPPPGVDPD